VRIRRFGTAPRRRILLVNPATGENIWTMVGTARLLGRKAIMPCSALATLVALTPQDVSVEYLLCDENVGKIPWDIRCDLVVVTGYSVQARRIAEVCKEFRARGRSVALGGIYATVEPDKARELADYLFLGEGEYIWPEFLRAWVAGNARREYRQAEPIDMADSPPPDWSLVRPSDYVYGTVQTTRGCPHRCDFCEVVKVFGRTFRHKSVEQVLAEVRASRAVTQEGLFFSDDNFVVNKRFTKELLQGLIAYNATLRNPLSFATQATVAIAEDEELLRLLADARFETIYLGVESPRRGCLEEINKGNISRLDPAEAVKRVSQHGISPFVGLICGFDHDDAETFSDLRRFIDTTASPVAAISLLNAAPGTPLYQRLLAENRVSDDFGGEWFFGTNILPRSMSMEQLLDGHRQLLGEIYQTDRFHDRLRRWLATVEYFSPLHEGGYGAWANINKFIRILYAYCIRAPRAERKAFLRGMRETAARNKKLMRPYMMLMCHYWHFFHFVKHATWQTTSAPAELAPHAPAPSAGTAALT
jgi:radical SAM superfamily enzyme YgiQ (UPF0313 family)